MFGSEYLDKLRDKYDYDNKTIKALSLIVPCIISYYGEEYSEIILEAILNCRIIPCSSKDTISMVLKRECLSNVVGYSSLYDLDVKRSESVYVPNVKVSYDNLSNRFSIDEINRIIVTSHTFNYDSLKGIEVLTHALCHLVKSYSNEIVIDENTIIFRNGISSLKRKLSLDEGVVNMYFMEEFGAGLEEGFNLYDTEKIVSLVCKDTYKCYDFDSVYTIASILKEKFGFSFDINNFEINGDSSLFKKKYGDENAFKLALLADQCVSLENDMFLSFTRDDKNEIVSVLNKKLSGEVYESLIDIYLNKEKVR